MNRAKAETIADRIMTRIETDKAIHKDAIADEVVLGTDEIIDVIWRDDDGVWKHRDGTPFDMDADVKQASTTGRAYSEFCADGSITVACDLDDRDTA